MLALPDCRAEVESRNSALRSRRDETRLRSIATETRHETYCFSLSQGCGVRIRARPSKKKAFLHVRDRRSDVTYLGNCFGQAKHCQKKLYCRVYRLRINLLFVNLNIGYKTKNKLSR